MKNHKLRRGLITIVLLSATSWLGIAYASDSSCDSEACKAQMQKLKEFGHNGSPEALAITALAYATGDGLEKDEDRARIMMKEAIRLNSSLGMYVKSKWRAKGFIFPKDEARADELLRESAKLGYEVANYEMAAKLLTQEDTMEEGAAYLQTAIDAGYIPALYVHARMIEANASDATDLAAAATVYAEAAHKNHRDAGERMRNIIHTLENEAEVDKEIVADLRELRDMEVITVYGQEMGLDSTLARVNLQLESLGFYDGRNTGTRLNRQRPCHMDIQCQLTYYKGDGNQPYSGGTVGSFFGL
ncbi:tetratricopeptide repeat protein [Aliidiomarina sp. Khilg15.8]